MRYLDRGIHKPEHRDARSKYSDVPVSIALFELWWAGEDGFYRSVTRVVLFKLEKSGAVIPFAVDTPHIFDLASSTYHVQ